MAVSEHEVSDFQVSFSRGSAEDFEHCCDSCLTEGHHDEAHGYCLDCYEYLCNNCFKYHKKTKATRTHTLLDKNAMETHFIPTKPVDVCTEKCYVNSDEATKCFCLKHEEIGCTMCMTMKHNTCDIDYIPDKCACIVDSEEYTSILKELNRKLAETDAVLKKAATNDKEIDDSHERVIKDIVTKRKEINDHLDSIQKRDEEAASEKKATSKQEVKAVISSCTDSTINIKKLQSSLQYSKENDQNNQLFKELKRAKSKLQSMDIQQAEMSLEMTRTRYKFNSNADLETILSLDSFGKLTEFCAAVAAPPKTVLTQSATPPKTVLTRATAPSTTVLTHAAVPPKTVLTHATAPPTTVLTHAVAPPKTVLTHAAIPPQTAMTHAATTPTTVLTHAAIPPQTAMTHAVAPPKTVLVHAAPPKRKGTFDFLQHKTNMNLNKPCIISACVALSSDTLMLAAFNYSSLMVVNTERNVVVQEKKLHASPWDIAVLPQDQIAVTMPSAKQILIVTTTGKTPTYQSCHANGYCYGIVYHKDCLYVLCKNPITSTKIYVLDMKGVIKNTIPLAYGRVFSSPEFIVLSQDQRMLYISNFGNNSIVSVTLQGEISAVYTDQGLEGPSGMLVLDDGSLLVCCFNDTIHHVSADLKEGRKVIDCLCHPQSLCYSADRNEVFIGGEDDKLQVCSIIYKL